MYNILRYNVKQHAKGMQNLLDKYIMPIHLKRMNLKPEQRLEYAEFEPILDPRGAYNKKFEDYSLAVVNESGILIGCQTNFIFTKESMLGNIKALQNVLDRKEDGSMLRQYCQHRLRIWFDFMKIYDKYPNIERVFYLESTIIEPAWRRHGISVDLHRKSLDLVSACELVFLDGRMPTKVWGSDTCKARMEERYEMGFKLHSDEITYDGNVCPLFYKPPSI